MRYTQYAQPLSPLPCLCVKLLYQVLGKHIERFIYHIHQLISLIHNLSVFVFWPHLPYHTHIFIYPTHSLLTSLLKVIELEQFLWYTLVLAHGVNLIILINHLHSISLWFQVISLDDLFSALEVIGNFTKYV